MNVLITGVAGAIGNVLARNFIKKGHVVYGLDNLSSGDLGRVVPEVNFFQKDITEVGFFFSRYSIDAVIHCAAQTDVRKSIEEPIYDAMENIFGGLVLLEEMKNYKIKRLVFLSSGGAVYGNAKNIPTPETEQAFPESPYGISKYALEKYIDFYSKSFGLEATILRLSNVSGISKGILYLIKTAPELKIYGGEQTRDFIHVTEVCTAVEHVLANKLSGVYNVASGKETPVKSLVLGVKCEFLPAIEGEVLRSCLDVTKLRETGWGERF